MKLFKSFFSVFMAAALTSACAKDVLMEENAQETTETPVAEELVRFNLDTDSKTQMDGAKVVWEANDSILVNGYKYSLKFDGAQAFILVRKSTSYTAFYPAQLWNGDKLYAQPAQFYRADNFGALSNPMYATAGDTDTQLQFHHLMGILKLTVKGSGTVASISVKDNNSGDVCGCYSYNSGNQSLTASSLQFPYVTLNCKTSSNGGVALTTSGVDFYVVMPARTYSKGLTVNIELVNGHSMQINSSTSRTIDKGAVLTTPAIDFAYDPSQIYEYHLDNMVLGSDPVGGKLGFKAANPAQMTGFEYLTQLTSTTTEDGTVDISTTNNNGEFSVLGKTYAYSRNIQNVVKVQWARECHGYFACGTGHSAKCSFKFPALTNLGTGIHKVEYNFKMAFQSGHKPDIGIQLLHTTSTPAKVLELYVDGVNVTGSMDNNQRWLSGPNTDGTPILKDATFTEERIFVRPDDFKNDYKWHDVKLILGAVTSKTVLEFQAFGSNVDQPWYIDDLKATKLEYADNLSNISFQTPSESTYAWADNYALMPSLYINPVSSTARGYLKTYSALYNLKYIDLGVGVGTLFSGGYAIKSLNDADWVEFDKAIAIAKAAFDDMGIKIWGIHLPYDSVKEGGVSDANAFEFCCTNSTAREAAVNRTKVIMKHLAPLAPKYWMVHTTYHHNWDFDGYTTTGSDKTYYKDCGVLSFKALVDYAKSLKYSDGTSGSFTIENIANTGDYSACLAGKVENLIWFCDQCPGLGICLDTGHAVVNSINCSDGDLGPAIKKMCDKGYLKHLHVHGNYVGNNKDCHILPGYKPGLVVTSSFKTTDTINWGKTYKALIDNGYRGAFSYEYSSPSYGLDYRDCISSFPNIIHNYFEVILKQYKSN